MLRPRKREGDTDDRGTSGRPRQLLLQLLLLVPVLNGFSPAPSRCFVRPLRRCGLELARSDLSELVSDAGVEMDEGNLERAEALLIEARASDPHRDMPRSLHNAFCRLFNEHAAAHPTETWPLEGLAALCTDSEDWDDLLEACRKAQRRGTLSPSMRMKRFHAARASFSWLDDPSSDGGDASGAATDDATTPAAASTTTHSSSLSFIDREAAELAAFSGAATVVPPFTALSMPLSPDVCARIAKAYLERSIAAAEQAMAAASSSSSDAPLLPPPPPPPPPGEPLVVGFLTPDANGAHPLGQLMAGTFRHFEKHEVVLFSMCRDDGSPERKDFEVGTRAVLDVTAWRPIDIAAEVRRQGVHVLVDLCGHAGTSDVTEVMALRPAALQIQGAMGTPAPMGDAPTTASMGGGGGGGGGGGSRAVPLPVYDYAIADAICVPDEALSDDAAKAAQWGWGGHFEHKALRLPRTYFVCDHARASRHVWAADSPDRASLGLPPAGEGVVLTCMNRGHKVDEGTFRRWLRVLRRTEEAGTVLWMLAPSAEGRSRLQAVAVSEGVDLARLVFADVAPRQAHLQRLRAADIALDTRVYNSHTLAADYAWAGLPMVTALYSPSAAEGADSSTAAALLPHEAAWASRVGASIMSSLGLAEEVVASDWDDAYEELAVELALDTEMRDAVKERLRRGRTEGQLASLWDTKEWARAVEDGVELAWEGRMEGRRRHIDVPSSDPFSPRVIVLDRPERIRHYQEQREKIPELWKFDAIDALREPDAAQRRMSSMGVTIASIWEPTAGQIGCACSHLSLWQEAADAADPWTIILEDDAVPSPQLFRPVVESMIEEKTEDWDLLYLYLHPEQRPNDLQVLANDADFASMVGRPWTQDGFHSWCLLAYVVSQRGARRLVDLAATEELYCPIDNWVSDLRARGLLRVRCPTTSGWVGNAGQIDLREQREDGSESYLPSNIWGVELWKKDSGA